MDYRIDLHDSTGRRAATFDSVPLLEVRRAGPDGQDEIRGLLPAVLPAAGQGWTLRVFTGGALCCEGAIERVAPHWGDTRRLILDRYVRFHHVLEVEARASARNGNRFLSQAHTEGPIHELVKDLINRAPGPVHYRVAHTAYPDGAQREHAKFLARAAVDNELGIGGIAQGQWVAPPRLDGGAAFAKDGDTIAGLVVDGEAWPDLRLMLIDSEETALNSHAISRHPECADWDAARYDRSGYKRRGDAAKAFLQELIDTKGIDFIELNPHRDSQGAFDDRVDAFGRYLGFAHGGGECFNAAMVEQGHADVYLYDEGRYHVPEMALKDYFSYAGAHADSIEETAASILAFDVSGGLLEALTALAYAAGGYVFNVELDLGIEFLRPTAPDRVVVFDPLRHAVRWGANAFTLQNILRFGGNPFTGAVRTTRTRAPSIRRYGPRVRGFDYFSISREEDAILLAEGLLDDIAWPELDAAITFFHGDAGFRAGDLIEMRGAPIRRVEPEDAEAWAGDFAGVLVGRVREIRHRFTGRRVETTVALTSPRRSVRDPLSFIVRSQPPASTLFEFRLDDDTVGLDLGYHLD